MKKVNILLGIVLAVVLTACNNQDSQKVSGAGATFPAPFYKVIFQKYSEETGSNVSYGAIGSGGGYRSLKDQTVDFGASDVFLKESEMQKLKGEVIHIPAVLGAVVLSYNLEGVKELKLTADVVSDIFVGNIKNWNDEKIKQLNPTVQLPNQAITVVYRSDGSGTTAVFSEYMSKVNDNWNNTIGEGKSLKFPVGVSAKGNAGVAGLIAETSGAIGYIGSEYALALNIPMASLQNQSGNFIKASIETISASANIEMPDDTRVLITNSSNPEAYPISTFTWLLVYKEQSYNNRNLKEATALKNLMQFVLSEKAQSLAQTVNYSPLSDKALEKAQKALETMTFEGKPIQ